MILLDTIQHEAINPAFALLPDEMNSPSARVMLLAIGLQESRFMFRYQKVAGKPYVKGPARGFWQFEKGGGVRGVMRHEKTEKHARELCAKRGCAWDATAIHEALETDDVLAAGFARLLLWSDLERLPSMNASHDLAWDAYFRNWRPGKPHRETWDSFHIQARGQVFA